MHAAKRADSEMFPGAQHKTPDEITVKVSHLTRKALPRKKGNTTTLNREMVMAHRSYRCSLFSSSTITKMDPKELNVKYTIAAIIHSKHIPIRRTGYLTNKQSNP
jgi:hypothetical protein